MRDDMTRSEQLAEAWLEVGSDLRVFLRDPNEPDSFVAVSETHETRKQAEETRNCIAMGLALFAEAAMSGSDGAERWPVLNLGDPEVRDGLGRMSTARLEQYFELLGLIQEQRSGEWAADQRLLDKLEDLYEVLDPAERAEVESAKIRRLFRPSTRNGHEKSSGWVKHPEFDAYEFQDKELRARVKYIHTRAAEYMWAVIECASALPALVELDHTQFKELAAGDTVGDDALEQGQNLALAALAEIRARGGRRIFFR